MKNNHYSDYLNSKTQHYKEFMNNNYIENYYYKEEKMDTFDTKNDNKLAIDIVKKHLIKFHKNHKEVNHIYEDMLNFISEHISKLNLINISKKPFEEKYCIVCISYYAEGISYQKLENFVIKSNLLEDFFDFLYSNEMFKYLFINPKEILLLEQANNYIKNMNIMNNFIENKNIKNDNESENNLEENILNNVNKMLNLHEEKINDNLKTFSLLENKIDVFSLAFQREMKNLLSKQQPDKTQEFKVLLEQQIDTYFKNYESKIDNRLIKHFTEIEEKTTIFYQKKLEDQYEKMLKHNEILGNIENIFSKQKTEINILISSLKEKDETIANLTNQLDNFLSKLNKLAE